MSAQIRASVVSTSSLLQLNTHDQMQEFARDELKAALGAPQHAASLAKALVELNDGIPSVTDRSPKSPPLTFRRAFLDEMQQRLMIVMEAISSDDAAPQIVSELLAMARLLPALLTEKWVAFAVLKDVLQDLLLDREAPVPPEPQAEAAVLMTLGLAPVLRASAYNCYALKRFLEDRYSEVLRMAKQGSYSARIISRLERVTMLIEEDWDLEKPSVLIQCLPRTEEHLVQFASLDGEIVYEFFGELTVSTLRRLLAKKFGLLEHEVAVISSKGELLRPQDLVK